MMRVRLLIFAAALTVMPVWPTLAEQTNETKHARPPLTEEQRAQLAQRLDDQWSKLSLREKMHVMRLSRALRDLPPDERRFINERIERFLNMPPEEKQKLRDNAERWRKMTPEQRDQARQEFRRRRADFEEKWKKEHPGEEPPPFPFRGEPNPAPPPPAEP